MESIARWPRGKGIARRPGGHAWSSSRRLRWREGLGNTTPEREELKKRTFYASNTVHQAGRKVEPGDVV